MEKKDYIQYWKGTAAKDWKRVNLLFKNRDYVFALFCAHLTIEKLEGRYPDYQQALQQSYKSITTNKILARSNYIRKCLLKNLQ